MGLDYNALKPHSLSHLVDARIGRPGVDPTELITETDFSNDTVWEDILTVLTEGDSYFTTSGTGGQKTDAPNGISLVVGKTYLIHTVGTISAGNITIRNYSGGTTYSSLGAVGNFDVYDVFTADETGLYIRGSGATSISFTTFSIKEWNGEELIPDPNVGFVANDVTKWTAYGANIKEQDGNYIKTTYIDNAAGSFVYLRNTTTGSTFSDLVVGQKYLVQLRIKTNGIGNVQFQLYNNGLVTIIDTNTTDETVISQEFTLAAANPYVRSNNLNTGEIAWIEILSVKKISGLCAAYNMIPNGDTLVDISGGGANGADVGEYSVISDKDGVIFTRENVTSGAAYHIPTANADRINFTTEPFTIVGRIKLKSYVYGTILNRRTAANGWAFGTWTSGKFIAYLQGVSGNSGFAGGEGCDTIPKLNKWYTVGIVIYNNMFIYYLNGVNDGDFSFTAVGSITNVADVKISDGTALGHLDGAIADLKVFNYALSAQEHADYHNSFAKQVKQRDDMSDYGVGDTI